MLVILAIGYGSLILSDALNRLGDAIRDKKEAEHALIDCLNGKPVGYYENGTGQGHGRTYITCRVEEFPV